MLAGLQVDTYSSRGHDLHGSELEASLLESTNNLTDESVNVNKAKGEGRERYTLAGLRRAWPSAEFIFRNKYTYLTMM
jgi:hypothetical protein